MEKIPNLDTLRFIAASLVICQHIELYKSSFSLENNWDTSFFRVAGNIGVVLFFVLSAFLITTLLLKEKERDQTISFKKFYLRRILRIWPLYYLIIFLGFFVWPNLSFFEIPSEHNRFVEVQGDRLLPNLFLYLLGFSQMGRTLYGDVAFTSQTWSLATEQLFYLIWPFVVAFFNKKLLSVMLLIVVLYHGIMYFLITGHAYVIPHSRFILSFLVDLNIHCMAIGGIFAVVIHKKSGLIKFIFNPLVFYGATLLSVILVLIGKTFSVFHYDVYAVLFGIMISNLAFNERFSKVLENKITSYFGTISYGIYMYHCIFIVMAIRLGLYFNAGWIVYPITFLMTIVVSHLSYNYFESYFLRLKPKSENRSAISKNELQKLSYTE